MARDYRAILGDAGASYMPVLKKLLSGKTDGHRYEFMSSKHYGELSKSDWKESQRIYWLEILYRAHFAAYTSLVRTSRWLDAMGTASEAANYTAFVAAYRGCLEAAADSFDAFEQVPSWIAELHSPIKAILKKNCDQPYIFKDLEDKLIHFTHARHVKKDEVVEASHRVKQTKQYLQTLTNRGVQQVDECYRTVCDVTHPGVGSVRCYAGLGESETGTYYQLRTDLDAELIEAFCEEYKQVSAAMMHVSVFPPAITLRILNEFGTDSIYTETVTAIGLEDQPIWKHFAEILAGRVTGKYVEAKATDPKDL